MRFTFRAHERLRRREDFLRVRKDGRKRVGRAMVAWGYRRPEEPPRLPRLGVAVGRRFGPAVQRNLFKRRIREVFRLNKHGLPRGWDILISPKTRDNFPPDQRDLLRDFLEFAAALKPALHPPSAKKRQTETR